MRSEQIAVSSNKPHRNLLAWQKGIELVIEIYNSTKSFPKEEIFGLTSQLRRAAISVPSNIAEGAADRTTEQFCNFLSNSIGSLNEIDTQLYLGLRLGYLAENEYRHLHEILDDCLALTYGLRKSLRTKKRDERERRTAVE
jgi:four helix bundle protein